MNGLFVVHLIGVIGLLVGLGFFVSAVIRMRRTMEEMERTLHSVCGELVGLMPRISSALQQVERTGEDIGRTANSSTALLNRLNGRSGSSPALDGAVRFLPAAAALLRLAVPFVTRRRGGKGNE